MALVFLVLLLHFFLFEPVSPGHHPDTCNYQPESRQILEPRLAYLITNIISDRRARIPAFGTPNSLELANERPAAAKTGTTNNFTDNWTVGYTPQIAVGVWQGNKDADDFMINTPGARGASYIWHAVMEYALKDEPIVPFTRPEGLVEFTVCATSLTVL